MSRHLQVVPWTSRDGDNPPAWHHLCDKSLAHAKGGGYLLTQSVTGPKGVGKKRGAKPTGTKDGEIPCPVLRAADRPKDPLSKCEDGFQEVEKKIWEDNHFILNCTILQL